MNEKLIEFAKNIEAILTHDGVKMGTKKAKEMEACMMTGYIYGSGTSQPYLTLLCLSGRQLTDEVKRHERI